MTRRTFLGLPVAAGLLSPRVAARPAAPSRFTIALVRPEGYLVPVAAFADGRWKRVWPQAGEFPRYPATIETTPTITHQVGKRMRETWHVWRWPDAPPVVTHVSGVKYVDSHCSRQLVLTTDLPPQTMPAHTFPLDVQFAADTDLPADVLRLIHVVPKTDSRALEAARVVNARLGREGPAKIVALYAETGMGRSPMYVVAQHILAERGRRTGSSCEGRTVLTGWLMPDDFGRLVLRRAVVFHADCDGKPVRTARPLAGIHIGERRFWVLRDVGYEDERSIIAEFRRSTIEDVLVNNGGGC